MTFGSRIALTALAALTLSSVLAGAHARDYAVTEYRGALLVAFQFSNTCIDGQFAVAGQGGAIGSLTNSLGSTLDPSTPDVGGTCYRKNHLFPNANGDMTFFVGDSIQTNVGACLTQDSNNNGVGCGDENDLTKRFCNQVTVNIHVDPNSGLSGSNVYRFQDSQGVPSLLTALVVTRVRDGSAILALLAPGPYEDCGAGVDAYGTTGNFNHS